MAIFSRAIALKARYELIVIEISKRHSMKIFFFPIEFPILFVPTNNQNRLKSNDDSAQLVIG